MKPTSSEPVTFDRLGLVFIQPFWWMADQPGALASLFLDLISSREGQAWFQLPDGEWVPVGDTTQDRLRNTLEDLHGLWSSGDSYNLEAFNSLREKGRCSLFMDQARFRSRAPDVNEIPEGYFLALDLDWTFDPDGFGTLLTPSIRVTNYWPASEVWAPPPPFPVGDPEPRGASETATLLEGEYWEGLHTEFLKLCYEHHGLKPFFLELDGELPIPPVFYFASPTIASPTADDYMEGKYLSCLGELADKLLDSPDLTSTEINGGVLEGCLALFNHSPSFPTDLSLMVPLAGFEQSHLEEKISWVTVIWQDIDLDATWEVYDIITDLDEEQHFFSLWLGSLDSAMRLHEGLFYLLRKLPIQTRMFGLGQLLTGFLANLHARTYAGAKTRTELRRKLDWSIQSSQSQAQRRFSVAPISGLTLPKVITHGYTRTYRAFEDRISRAVEDAHALSRQIEDVSQSLSYSAELEEQRQERERRSALAREERAAKRLNLVLAMVAVLAAIPLIVGQFETSELAEALPWFPFHLGLYFSFGTAVIAFVATVVAILITFLSGRKSSAKDRVEDLDTVEAFAADLFDGYRSYKHPRITEAVAAVKATEGTSTPQVEGACKLIHQLDRRLAGAVARSLRQAEIWGDQDKLPETDEEWARSMEFRVCRFVLMSDVFDLRPEYLHLPITLSLYRFRHEMGGLSRNPVSGWEFHQVLETFGIQEQEATDLEEWAASEPVQQLEPLEFARALEDRGITAMRIVASAGE